MPDFGQGSGAFITNLLRSLQEEAERLPDMVEALRESDPTPRQVGDFAGKCIGVAVKAVSDVVQGVREAAQTFNDPTPDFNVPDDLSDLG